MKMLSRKFLVFIIGTGLLAWGKIDPQTWLILAGFYIGANIGMEIINKGK